MTSGATTALMTPAAAGNGRTPVLLSVNVGLPRDVAWQGKTVHTGIWKEPVSGPVMARRLNIDGDGQGDLNGHGGEQRAVLVYQIESYRHWEQHFGRDDFGTASSARTSPSTGCPTTRCASGTGTGSARRSSRSPSPGSPATGSGMRLGEPEMPALLVSHHRPGFYMRVLREGRIQAGDQIIKTRTGPDALSVTDTDALLYLPGRDLPSCAAAQIPALSPGWQRSFRELIDAAERVARPRAAARHRPARPAPAWTGFRPLRVTQVVPGNHRGDLDLPRRRGRGRAPAGPGRAVHDPAGHRRRAARPGAQLLAVVRARAPAPTGSASSTNPTAPPAPT